MNNNNNYVDVTTPLPLHVASTYICRSLLAALYTKPPLMMASSSSARTPQEREKVNVGTYHSLYIAPLACKRVYINFHQKVLQTRSTPIMNTSLASQTPPPLLYVGRRGKVWPGCLL